MLRAIRGDITKILDVDAIVNAANETLLGGGGVDGAIHRAAGEELRIACAKLHGCKTGEVKITGGYHLPCEYVIHAVGPIWYGGTVGERELLAWCYENSLKIAEENGIRRIAFPSISTGAYHFPVRKAAVIAVNTVRTFLREHEAAFDLVEWVLFDDDTWKAYQEQIETEECI